MGLGAELAGPPPAFDRPVTADGSMPLRVRRGLVADLGVEFRTARYYPPGGGMGWHTNSDAPGWRIYVVRTPEDGRSFMRTLSGLFLDKNLHANLFEITTPELSWHCIGAPTERWSLGVRAPGDLVQQILRI